jgi:uncharacterized phosphosugar-binding protein
VTDKLQAFFDRCMDQLKQLKDESAADIQAAALAVADAIQNERGYFLFGSGHSALVAQEAYWRAGGLAPALPISDPMGGDAERLVGYGALLLAHYDLQAGDVIVIISNSGINPLPVEMALECKARGLTVVAITCLAHSQAVPSRHPSGRKLYEAADIVVDTHGEPGDALLDLPGLPGKVGALSTLLGIAIIEAITVQAASILGERGLTPPVLVSSNLPEGDAHNRALVERYRGRMVRSEVPSVDEKTAAST